ncbi:MAG: 30S ribosomal protein S12 methylthiotransferase RimO [Eubacteriales bacterium]|nr:30S ribosomal protein S12 methylthiotransferase RimO [Eubacteriales bacterium]
MKIFFLSLGCDKNKVDSEKLLFILSRKCKNIIFSDTMEEADLCIINTCSFIHDAKKESKFYIERAIKLKKSSIYNLKYIMIFGCFATEYKKTIKQNYPSVDYIFTLDQYNVFLNKQIERINDITSFSQSLKISDGCNKRCSYCIIPKLRGNLKSEKIENLFLEAKNLAKQGTVELNLVAQDTLSYGIDLYKKKCINELLNKLSIIKEFHWIRLLYCYPEEIDQSLINTIKSNEKIVNYIDMPIQHISNRILNNMNRNTTSEKIYDLIRNLRNQIDDISLRTTLIVGFPGETEKDFFELCAFVENTKFDNLGVFTYSDEKNSKSFNMKNKIPYTIKEFRKNTIMQIQKNIIIEKNNHKIGKIYEVIVEGFIKEKNLYIGRNAYNASNIDTQIYFKAKDKYILSGTFVYVKITSFKYYDLYGEKI